MKVLKFEIENYKALEGRHEIIPEGSSFFLVGANGQGKTSAGRALIDMMTKNHPSKPITEGEQEGFVRITFDNFSKVAVKYEDGKKPKLTFITSEGHRIATPVDFFKEMAGDGMTFNIDEFLKLSPKPRRAMLEKMVGVDLSKFNAMEAAAMEQAKEARAAHKIAAARVKPFDKKLLDKALVDVVELSTKISDAKEQRHQLRQTTNEIDHHLSEIRELQERIRWLNQKVEDLEVVRQDLIDKTVDDFELAIWEDDLSKADQTNQAIREAREMAGEAKKAEDLKSELEEAEAEVLRIRQAKEDEIKSKPLPAQGLEFDPDGDGLLLNGLPFEDAQIATSAKMIAALQIAEAQLGKIRYLHFDAAILDKENAMRVLEWAESKDLQLCIERPLWDGGELKMEVWDLTGEKVKEVVV